MRISGYLTVGVLAFATMLGTAVAQDRDHDRDDHWRNSPAYQAGLRDAQEDRADRRQAYAHRHDWERDNDDRQAYMAGYNAAIQQNGGNWGRDRDHDGDHDRDDRYRGVNGNNGYYGNNAYGGRLNQHDQYVYNQLYNNYLQAHQINDPAQVQKAESAMQNVYRKYGIPPNTPYGAVATGR